MQGKTLTPDNRRGQPRPGLARHPGARQAGDASHQLVNLCRAKTHSPSLSWCFALLRLLSGTR